MAYESVVWTPKTPMTWDRLAQMQQNIDELRATIEGTSAYVPGGPQGVGKGILYLQELTTSYYLPSGDTFVQIGASFTPITQAGRRYLMQCYLPRYHTPSGVAVVRFFRDGVVIQTAIHGNGTDLSHANTHGVPWGNFSGTANVQKHIVPGASTTSVYHVDTVPLFAPAGFVFNSSETVGFIKFTDVGPAQ
jgi:hypothetical protein